MSTQAQPLTDEELRRQLALQPQGMPSIPGTGVMPTIARPPNESQGQENRAVGKAQYGAELPQVTAQAGTPEYGQQKVAQLDYQKMHPWGADVSAQPGAWGKIGHVLAKVGNIAGNALIPNVMASAPGTQLNQSFERKEAEQEIGEGEKNKLEEAQAQGWAPMMETLPNGQTVMMPFRNAGAFANTQARGEQAQDLQKEKGTESEKLLGEKGTQQTALQTQKDTAAGQRTEEQIEGRADVASKKPGTDFDQFYKDYLEDHKLPDSAHARLMARNEYAMAGQKPTAEPGNYVPVPDPSDPLHKIAGWVDPKSGHFRPITDIPGMAGNAEIKPTGQEASREGQAQVVGRAGDGLIKTIQSNRESIGNVDAIIKSAFLQTPLSDPKQAGVAAEIASFAALQPAMHGFRGQQAMDQFEKIIGGIPKNPDALISSIKAIQKTAGYFNPNQKQATGADAGGIPSFAQWKASQGK